MSDTRRVPKARSSATDEDEDGLPYRVELWDAPRRKLERVLARASSNVLARAIFKAAQAEYPERRITLRRGSRVIAEAP
jgi:hypothetical protein